MIYAVPLNNNHPFEDDTFVKVFRKSDFGKMEICYSVLRSIVNASHIRSHIQ